jgi:predicted AAA+ superfamily ATPase
MPEIVSTYAATRQLTGLRTIYERLLSSMILQINRHTKRVKHCAIVEDTLQNSFPFAATRIKFNQFGNSRHRTREMGEAFRTLEQHLLLHLLYPSISTHFAANMPDREKSPRLQLLDTGLVNYFSGIQKALFQSQDMNAIFEGQIARQVVGQEILAAESQDNWNGMQSGSSITDNGGLKMSTQPLLNFWVRDKAQSTAEVDFVIPFNDLLIPVSVKSGEPGRLRSLHQFIDMAPHAYAVRLYAGKLTIQQAQTLRGKKYYLLSLPYFMASKIKDHLKGFIRLTNG